MKRATTLLGLLRQAFSVRWNAASRGAKVAAVALVAFAGVGVAQALTCGACGAGCHAATESSAANAVAAPVDTDADQGCAYSNR